MNSLAPSSVNGVPPVKGVSQPRPGDARGTPEILKIEILVEQRIIRDVCHPRGRVAKLQSALRICRFWIDARAKELLRWRGPLVLVVPPVFG